MTVEIIAMVATLAAIGASLAALAFSRS